MDQLHFKDEVKNIKIAIHASDKEVFFKSMVATKANLGELL